jgi:hypothetical protein
LAGLVQQRCANHSQREAVARCPDCGRFYCRECITEHEDRVLCAACLAKKAGRKSRTRSWVTRIGRVGLLLASFLFLWIFFYVCGRTLLAIPSSFHEGTFLKVLDIDGDGRK